MKARAACLLIVCSLFLTGCDFLKSFFGEEEPAPPPAPPKPPPVVKSIPKPKPDPKPGPIIMQDPEPEPLPAFPWHEILGPSQAELPEPNPTLKWHTDLDFALSEAVLENRPLLVIVTCNQPEFDQWTNIQKKLDEPTPELSAMLRQFITVKITQTRNMNLNVLPFWKYQDPDNSWWVYMLSDVGSVYSVFGGRDHRSKHQRITTAGLTSAMQRVLNHHYDPRRADWNQEWNLDGPAPNRSLMRPEHLPAYNQWLKVAKGGTAPPSLEFHEIYDIYYHHQFIKSQGRFSQKWIWPYPENIGLEMDPKDTLVVKSVNPGSVAENVGILPGDVLGAANNKRLFTETDLRAQLNQVSPTGGTIELHWVSQGNVKSSLLILPENWKQTNLLWRMTTLYGIHSGPIPGFLIHPLTSQERARLNIANNVFAGFAITKPGTTPHDQWKIPSGQMILIKVNEAFLPNMSPTHFLAWFRTNFKVNEPLSYTFMGIKGQTVTMKTNIYALEYAPYNMTVRDSLVSDQ